MIVIVFRSTLLPGVLDKYVTEVERMSELATTMPGYISHKSFSADDGERVTVAEFETKEGLRTWRMNPEHREAQRKACEIYYSSYSVQVCEMKRESKFDRNALGNAAE